MDRLPDYIWIVAGSMIGRIRFRKDIVLTSVTLRDLGRSHLNLIRRNSPFAQ
jgi:hypothetical protein